MVTFSENICFLRVFSRLFGGFLLSFFSLSFFLPIVYVCFVSYVYIYIYIYICVCVCVCVCVWLCVRVCMLIWVCPMCVQRLYLYIHLSLYMNIQGVSINMGLRWLACYFCSFSLSIYTGCLNKHGTNVTAYNSTTNNMFFFCFRFENTITTINYRF